MVTYDPPPVRQSNIKQSTDIDILWGGYYVSQEEGSDEFDLFRLLDFNRYAYHAALFGEKFSEIPSLDQICALTPFIGHVPMDACGLLRAPVQLVGGAPLTNEDLEGYMIYLEHHDVSLFCHFPGILNKRIMHIKL